jgi:hypothetical protein
MVGAIRFDIEPGKPRRLIGLIKANRTQVSVRSQQSPSPRRRQSVDKTRSW